MAGKGAKFRIGPQVSIWGGSPEAPKSFTDPLNIGTNGALSFEPQEPDIGERISTLPDATEGQALDTDLTPKPQNFTLSVDDVEAANGSLALFAAAFSGQATTFAQAAVAKVPVSFTVDQLGGNHFAGARNLEDASAVLHKGTVPATGAATGTATGGSTTTLVMTDAGWTIDALINKKVLILTGTGAGQVLTITDNDASSLTFATATAPAAGSTFAIVEATALTEDTDYAVIADRGDIKPLSGGTLAVGDSVHGFVDSLAITGGKAIQGGTKSKILFSLKGEAKNKLTGEMGHLFVPKVVAYASENVELASGDFLQTALSGQPQIPSQALLQSLGWAGFVDADGANLWGADITSPTTLYVFIPSETRAAA